VQAGLAPGHRNSTGMSVNYTGSTASAGAISGTATLSYTSKGQLGTGLIDATPTLASETVAVTSTIYRLASGTFSGGTVNLGNVRIGSAFGSGTVSMTNTAANDGFSDLLRVRQAASGNGFVVLGGSQTLSAMQSGTFAIGLSSTPTAIGVTRGSVTFGLTSVGQSGTGLADVTLSSQVLNLVVTGNVYRSGSGVLSSGSVALASIRESGTFSSTALTLTNGAVNDGFSEKLNASFGTLGGSAISSGSVQLLAAGSSNSTGLSVGLTHNGSAGLKSGSVTVAYETDGNGTSGLASEAVGSGTVAVTGKVYRLAVGSVGGTLTLAPIRENGSFVAKNVTVGNVASSDGYSDDLAAAISSTSAGIVVSGSAGRISAGTQNGTGISLNYTGGTSTAGAVSGTAALAYTSLGQVGTGLSDAMPAVATQTVTMSGAIYRLASASLSTGTLNLGNIRTGSAFGSGSVTVTNTAANDGYSDLLRVSQTGDASRFAVLGGTQTLAASGTGTFYDRVCGFFPLWPA